MLTNIACKIHYPPGLKDSCNKLPFTNKLLITFSSSGSNNIQPHQPVDSCKHSMNDQNNVLTYQLIFGIKSSLSPLRNMLHIQVWEEIDSAKIKFDIPHLKRLTAAEVKKENAWSTRCFGGEEEDNILHCHPHHQWCLLNDIINRCLIPMKLHNVTSKISHLRN